ncbi:MAG: tetratricopeptide repeat protein [Promethearchaeota archaeon]
MIEVNYPSEDFYNTFKKNFEHLILWMLANNEVCEWSYFTQEPLSFSTSTLSKYFNLIKSKGHVEKLFRGHYKITPKGRESFHEISRTHGKKKRLNYPPDVIKRKRDYEDWIIWMVYNNNFCKWSDFIEDPLSINRSSLSKKMNLLIEKEYVKHDKDNKEYRITHSGKFYYSKMLQKYDLDRQSILNEESKRIEEINKKTINFFDKYNIKNEDIQFRYLNNVLRLDYVRVKAMLTDEEDFDKILLYLSMNHPDLYPNYISMEEFSNTYGIKKAKLEYYIDEIVETQIYSIKIFKLVVPPNDYYYFQENEKIEIMLRAITEEYITKLTYISKLFSRSIDLRTTIDNIIDDICGLLFNECFKESLNEFLQEYINYLAYKIEAKAELREIHDKLEGIIWQDVINIFQTQMSDGLKDQYDEKIGKIDKEIESNPDKIELYISKISILLYYEQLDDVLNLLEEMIERFPENEIDIMMKKASVLKRMRKVESGLDIIDDLIEKYPENNDLLNYKVYWLQYLNRKEEALELIQDLVDAVPDNGTYHDTYGEILMRYQEYERAIDKFLRAIKLARDEWYINQTYIKLGICYKELNKFKLAFENLTIGKNLMEESSIDPETKQKWLVIVNLFLSEIEESK